MKLFIFLTVAFLSLGFAAKAEEKMTMNFVKEDLTTIIQAYAKASGKSFIIDPTVRGDITILNSADIPLDQAYNQLSSALAVHGFAITNNAGSLVVRNAFSVKRSTAEVVYDVPTMKPQRMVTWIIQLKNISAEDVVNQIRLLCSPYGEISAPLINQIMITDWTANLQRVSEIIKKVDVPPATLKLISQLQIKQDASQLPTSAEAKIKLNFKSLSVVDVIALYAKASGKSFIVDSQMKDKITILNQNEISLDDAFDQISLALASNSMAIVKQDQLYIIRTAGSAQRDILEVTANLPNPKPQRVVTWVINLKNPKIMDQIAKQLRYLVSSNSEVNPIKQTGQIIVTDFSSNMQRIADAIKKTDVAAATKPDQ